MNDIAKLFTIYKFKDSFNEAVSSEDAYYIFTSHHAGTASGVNVIWTNLKININLCGARAEVLMLIDLF